MTVQIREYHPTDEPALRAAIEQLRDYVVALDPIRRLRKQPGYVDHETKSTLAVLLIG